MTTNYENKRMNSSGWMTIPEWVSVQQVNVSGREREAENLPRADAPENFHVLVRGVIDLPGGNTDSVSEWSYRKGFAPEQTGARDTYDSGTDEYELLVAADDHYQLWIDGVYQGQGPAASWSDCCYYDSYPLENPAVPFGSQMTDQDDRSLHVKPAPRTPLRGAAGMSNDISIDNSGPDCKMGAHKDKITVALHLYYHGRISRSWTSGDGRFGVWVSVRRKRSWEELVRCDENWRYLICKAYSGETVGYDTQFLENFDSHCWPEGWERPEFDVDDLRNTAAGSWGHLVPALWADYKMMPRPIRMLEEKRICPVAHTHWTRPLADVSAFAPVSEYSAQSAGGRLARGTRLPLEEGAGGRPMETPTHQGSAAYRAAIDRNAPCLDSAASSLKDAARGDGLPRKCPFAALSGRSAIPLQDATRGDGLVNELLDFGREITGAILAEATGPAGAQVVIRYGEELEEAKNTALPSDSEGSDTAQLAGTEAVDDTRIADIGSLRTARPSDGGIPDALPGRQNSYNINQLNVRWNMRCGCAYQEIWTLGEGISRFHPYDYKGFRYVQLIYPKSVKIREVSAWVRHYPMEEDACSLKSGDELEQIFEICKNAVRCCSQDGYLDCPTREKGQYLGDALITGRSQVWLTGTTELLRKCMDDFIASQRISPSMMAVAPGSVMQEIADFSLLFPLLPLTDYEFTADQEYLARCYPAVQRLTESFLIYQRPDGLLENVGDLWNLVDWPENLRDGYDFALTRPVVGEGCHNVINALWYGANQMQEQMERLLGLPVTGRTGRIAQAYHAAFYRKDSRLFADSEKSEHCSLHANLYAAYFGLLPQEAENAYLTLLQTPGRVCGALPAYFALKSAAKIGRPDVCFRLMTREDAYGWRNMLREGASASFEAWGKDQKWNTSLCHGWSSGFIPLFIEEIAGLHPDPENAGQRSQGADAGGCKLIGSQNLRTESEAVNEASQPFCAVSGKIAGLRFVPPRIPECPDFVLRVPWHGKTLRIVKQNGKMEGQIEEKISGLFEL
ncbi:MAG: family 78 glycoside hydrolase catalytic domain [Lachnospiraceae bacterium]|nr:family 78 glycoside hydrolase catalytic domain [Lachnospiraceae bacterium]